MMTPDEHQAMDNELRDCLELVRGSFQILPEPMPDAPLSMDEWRVWRMNHEQRLLKRFAAIMEGRRLTIERDLAISADEPPPSR